VTSDSAVRKASRPTRIYIDLAEDRLEEAEIEAIGAWLHASAAAEPPDQLLKIAIEKSRARAAVA
jgi:hypothetical protein